MSIAFNIAVQGFALIGFVVVSVIVVLLIIDAIKFRAKRKAKMKQQIKQQILWEVWHKLSNEGQITMGDCIADDIQSVVERNMGL